MTSTKIIDEGRKNMRTSILYVLSDRRIVLDATRAKLIMAIIDEYSDLLVIDYLSIKPETISDWTKDTRLAVRNTLIQHPEYTVTETEAFSVVKRLLGIRKRKLMEKRDVGTKMGL